MAVDLGQYIRSKLRKLQDTILGTSQTVDVTSRIPQAQRSARVQASIDSSRPYMQASQDANSAGGFGRRFLFESLPDTIRHADRLPDVTELPGAKQVSDYGHRQIARIKNPILRGGANVIQSTGEAMINAPGKVLKGALGTGANLADIAYQKPVQGQKILADAASIGEGLLAAYTPGKAVGVAKAGLKVPLMSTIKQGMKTGFKTGAAYGLTTGLQSRRDAENVRTQVAGATKDAALSGAVGTVAGGVLATSGALLGKAVRFVGGKKAIAKASTLEPTGDILLEELKRDGVKRNTTYASAVRNIKSLKQHKFDAGNVQRKVVEQYKKAMQKTGKVDPIVITQKGEVLDGNHRILAAQELGIKKIPVIVERRGRTALEANPQAGFLKIGGEPAPGQVQRDLVSRARAIAKQQGIDIPEGMTDDEILTQIPMDTKKAATGKVRVKGVPQKYTPTEKNIIAQAKAAGYDVPDNITPDELMTQFPLDVSSKKTVTLYHGSRTGKLTGDTKNFNKGTFLTDDPDYAKLYSGDSRGGAGNATVYKVEVPIDAISKTGRPNEVVLNQPIPFANAKKLNYIDFNAERVRTPQKYTALEKEALARAKAQGFDVPENITGDELLSQAPMGPSPIAQMNDSQAGFFRPAEFIPSFMKAKRGKLPVKGGKQPPSVVDQSESLLGSIPPGTKERGFPQTVQTTPGTPEAITASLKANREFYTPLSNEKVVKEVQKMIKKSAKGALEFARGNKSTEGNATALLLIDKALKKNDFDTAENLVREFSPRFTQQGQEIQILSLYGRLTPSGALRYAQKVIDKANKELPAGRKLEMNSDVGKEIVAIAEKLQSMPEGREKQVMVAQMMQKIANQVPEGIGSKLSTAQIFAQLLNPKTAIRNVVGNTGFGAVENVKDVAATPIDMGVTGVRNMLHKIAPKYFAAGERSKVLPSIPGQVGDFVKGAKQGIEEVKLGIETNPAAATQFDLPRTPAFQGRVGTAAHKLLNYELKVPDRAAYTAAYGESLRQQMVAKGVQAPDEVMKEVAHGDALYRTFQDNSVAARLFSGIKKGLNLGKSFGFGDLVLKYPKTPGNLLARSIDYSPAGFVKAVSELAKPLIKGTPFNQRQFVEDTSRALTGTGGIVGTGAILHRLGIISGEQEKDTDIRGEQRAAGLGAYKLNLSALKRLMLSGLDTEAAKPKDGDTLISYDWFQPMSVGLAIGADLDRHSASAESIAGRVIEGLASGTQTLAEQPLLTGIERIFSTGNIPEGVMNTLSDAPASFVPTILNQVKQLFDNSARETQDPGIFERGFNRAINRTPLAGILPERRDVTGQVQENYSDSVIGKNNLFNVFLNPAFVSKLKLTPEGGEILNMFNQSGETQQARRVAPNKVDISKNGVKENIVLTGEQKSQYQEFIGKVTTEQFRKLVENPTFQAKSDDEKAKEMANIASDVNTAAKIILFGHQPQKLSAGARAFASLYRSGTLPQNDFNAPTSNDTLSVGPQDAQAAELSATGQPGAQETTPGTRFETLTKQKETFKEVAALLDSGAEGDQLNSALSSLGVSPEDAKYYDIARKDTELKTAYIMDKIDSGEIGKGGDLVSQLADYRRQVGGAHILANGVVDDLYDEGIITSSQKKFLKSLQTDKKTGQLAVKKGSGGKKKKKVQFKLGSFKGTASRVARVKVASARRGAPKKIRIKAIPSNTAKLTFKGVGAIPTVEQYKRKLGV